MLSLKIERDLGEWEIELILKLSLKIESIYVSERNKRTIK